MKTFVRCLLPVAIMAAGCVTRREADARARIAFLEGQNQALLRMHSAGANVADPQVQPQAAAAAASGVTFIGAVQNPNVAWRTGLTLAQAIVSAHYQSATDPTVIVIHRGNQDIPFNPHSLLNGEDFVLQIGDVIEIQ